MCYGASKQSSDPKYSTTSGPRLPVLIFLDPPLGRIDDHLTVSTYKEQKDLNDCNFKLISFKLSSIDQCTKNICKIFHEKLLIFFLTEKY